MTHPGAAQTIRDAELAAARDEGRREARAAQPLTDAEIERLAVEHEAFGFGRACDRDNVSIHGFEPEGLIAFVRAIEKRIKG